MSQPKNAHSRLKQKSAGANKRDREEVLQQAMYSQRSTIQGQRRSHAVVKRLTGAGRRTRIETVCCMKSQAELPIADESSAMILLFVVWPLVSNNTETYPFGGPMSSKDMCDSWGHDDFGPRRRRSIGQPTLSLLRPLKPPSLTHWRAA